MMQTDWMRATKLIRDLEIVSCGKRLKELLGVLLVCRTGECTVLVAKGLSRRKGQNLLSAALNGKTGSIAVSYRGID